jgi:hypothetical protein
MFSYILFVYLCTLARPHIHFPLVRREIIFSPSFYYFSCQTPSLISALSKTRSLTCKLWWIHHYVGWTDRENIIYFMCPSPVILGQSTNRYLEDGSLICLNKKILELLFFPARKSNINQLMYHSNINSLFCVERLTFQISRDPCILKGSNGRFITHSLDKHLVQGLSSTHNRSPNIRRTSFLPRI